MACKRSRLTVFDCDPGIDDALAIYLGISLHDAPCAVITSYGCSGIANTTRNARRILDLLDRSDVPVIRGSSRPLIWPHPIDGRSLPTFFGRNGLNNVRLPVSHRIGTVTTPQHDAFVEHVAGLLRSVRSVDYYLTGPCTNLARICLRYPDLLKDKIRRLHIIGGAFGDGNSGTKDPRTGLGVCEFNFYLDPLAVHLILALDLKPRLVTWDQAKAFRIPRSTLRVLHSKSEATRHLLRACRHFFRLYAHDTVSDDEKHEEPFLILSDPLVLMTDHRSGRLLEKRIDIILGGDHFGRSIESPNGHIVEYFELVHPSVGISCLLEGVGAELG